jgi:hypothetical protein
MDLLNATRFQAAYTLGTQPDGRELLVVVAKGTFAIPAPGQEPRLAEAQAPLVMADTFTGEPGVSAPVSEADFAPRKAHCDVVLNGSAYAPQGRPTRQVPIGLRVGRLTKSFNVLGDRLWVAGAGLIRATDPQPFQVMPISYDRAFGGVDRFHPDPARHHAFMQNPVGRGFHAALDDRLVNGTPLPNTEAAGERVTSPSGRYRPMAFGPVGRGWEPRLRFAGTYDQQWIDDVFPFLPADFDERYYQCAPADQQVEYLHGGEEVNLVNLTPAGRTVFRLPTLQVPVVYFYRKGGRQEVQAVADTLALEPDAGRFTITWRASVPIRRNIFEVAQVLVGRMSRAWWRARELGKTYYPSLAALSRARHAEARERGEAEEPEEVEE